MYASSRLVDTDDTRSKNCVHSTRLYECDEAAQAKAPSSNYSYPDADGCSSTV
jgi:hypothetical protein